MQIIQFTNGLKYKVVLKWYDYNDSILRLSCKFLDDIPSAETLKLGFLELNEYNDEIESDFSEYKYIYKIDNDISTYIFTNSLTDVYIDKPISVTKPTPTTDLSNLVIEELKDIKISELSAQCRNNIELGVSVDIDGNTEKFSYSLTNGDQNNIDDIFMMMLQTGLGQSYHCDGVGANCKIYTPPQIVALYVRQKMNKMHHETYFNHLKGYVNSLDNKNYIDSVTYGQELNGKYLDGYNLNMDNARLNITTMLNKLGIDSSSIDF